MPRSPWFPVCGAQCFSIFIDTDEEASQSPERSTYAGIDARKDLNSQKPTQRDIRVPDLDLSGRHAWLPLLACLMLLALIAIVLGIRRPQHSPPPIITPDCSQDFTGDVRALAYCCHHFNLHCKDLDDRAKSLAFGVDPVTSDSDGSNDYPSRVKDVSGSRIGVDPMTSDSDGSTATDYLSRVKDVSGSRIGVDPMTSDSDGSTDYLSRAKDVSGSRIGVDPMTSDSDGSNDYPSRVKGVSGSQIGVDPMTSDSDGSTDYPSRVKDVSGSRIGVDPMTSDSDGSTATDYLSRAKDISGSRIGVDPMASDIHGSTDYLARAKDISGSRIGVDPMTFDSDGSNDYPSRAKDVSGSRESTGQHDEARTRPYESETAASLATSREAVIRD